jgi:hypothetical protein
MPFGWIPGANVDRRSALLAALLTLRLEDDPDPAMSALSFTIG